MKTIVYVDGYNFYHGRLKHTAYKWLDLKGLLRSLIHIQNPDSELLAVKFFTANIKARLARQGQISVNAQSAYHRALAASGVEVVLGSFSLTRETAPRYRDGQPANRDDRVAIWALEEKQTDVRLALQLYRDLASGRCEQIVLCSNDSDFAPALQAAREDFPRVRVGLILPRSPELNARRSQTLEDCAHWTRHHLLDDELKLHQLPPRVATGKKPVDRPAHW